MPINRNTPRIFLTRHGAGISSGTIITAAVSHAASVGICHAAKLTAIAADALQTSTAGARRRIAKLTSHHAITAPARMSTIQLPAGRASRSRRDGGVGVVAGNSIDPIGVPFHSGTMRHSLPSSVASNCTEWVPLERST